MGSPGLLYWSDEAREFIANSKFASLRYKLAIRSSKLRIGALANIFAAPEKMINARTFIHVGEGVKADFHVHLWYEYVKSIDENAFVVLRSYRLFKKLISSHPHYDLIFVRSGIHAEKATLNAPNLKSILYVSNTGNTIHFLRFIPYKHIWLGHGDSEKAASCHKFFRVYDEIWCAGQAQIDRFKKSDMNSSSIDFKIVGRPMMKSIVGSNISTSSGKVFLYLPTWEGYQAEQDYNSIELVSKFLPKVAEMTNMKAIVKFHPWAGRIKSDLTRIENDLKSEAPRVEVLGRATLLNQLMPAAEFLIADVSSVISDFLVLDRPIFLFLPGNARLNFAESIIPFSKYCYIFEDSGSLENLIDQVIVRGDDYLSDERGMARNYFVNIEATIGDVFSAEMRRISNLPATT